MTQKPSHFGFVTLDRRQRECIERIESAANELYEVINESVEPSRELSLTMSKLDECVMWANRGVSTSPREEKPESLLDMNGKTIVVGDVVSDGLSYGIASKVDKASGWLSWTDAITGTRMFNKAKKLLRIKKKYYTSWMKRVTKKDGDTIDE